MKRKTVIFSVLLIALFLACSGITYAWFSQRAALSTLMNIIPPDLIEIYPVDTDGNNLAMLDLDFDDRVDSKTTNEAGDTTITIRRPVKIYSTSPVHQLEVVHTTNLNQLSFQIYPATKSDDGYKYTPNLENALSGSYINPIAENNSSLAAKEKLNNYKSGDTVESHAYPLYWLAVECGYKNCVSDWNETWTEVTSSDETKLDPSKQTEKTYYTTYYVLEITWQETTKETDLFYIMAQNIAVNTKNPDEGGENS